MESSGHCPFAVKDCRSLPALWEHRNRASAVVRGIARAYLDSIDAKIKPPTAMRGTLGHLVGTCAGKNRPDCPILKSLSSSGWKYFGGARRAGAEPPETWCRRQASFGSAAAIPAR